MTAEHKSVSRGLARIEEAVPAFAVAGTRYDEHLLRMLYSEQGWRVNKL
jgi:hypothetical protein